MPKLGNKVLQQPERKLGIRDTLPITKNNSAAYLVAFLLMMLKTILKKSIRRTTKYKLISTVQYFIFLPSSGE